MKIVYSFIIPHKNSPQLLNRCLNSIPQRDDSEIIVVDDHSDEDKKPLIRRTDVQVVFMYGENGGAGAARNVGLSIAKGDWLMFADADDYYSDYLGRLLDKYQADAKTEIVILNAMGITHDGLIKPLRMNVYIENYLKHRFYSDKVIRYGIWTPWSRLIKRSVVEKYGLRFENIPTGNDMMFCLSCSKYCLNLAVEDNIIYYYSLPEKRSLTNGYRWNLDSLEPRLELAFRRTSLYRDVHYAFLPFFFMDFCKPTIDRINKTYYRKTIIRILKLHNYSFIDEIINTSRYLIGRVLKIV